MAVMTLEELKKGMADKVFDQIVDIFLRESAILQKLQFDDCVSASGGGSTMKYKYMRKVLPATAQFRKLNAPYTASAATKKEFESSLAIMGGEVQLDRVLNKVAGRFDNLAYQIEEHIKAVISLFHYTLINGDAVATAATEKPEFEGLDSMVAGTSTELGTDKVIDLSNIDALKKNADEFYEALNLLIRTTDADALLLNTESIAKIQTVARLLGYKTESETAFGRKITSIDGVQFMDLHNHYTVSGEGTGASAVANAVVKKNIKRTVGEAETSGLTDIYAVKFDVNDGFHGISLSGGAVIDKYLPDFNKPGVMKNAEVEMIAATVLKNTEHAGVLRNIKIA
ncbi:major capsid protein [Parablautia muri]|nr:phage capsid protein [Parablautia muri]